ncbi:hypothetical protein NDU88_002077 [Pleurodeles waltl]|uniref:Uncharacterized protein n=1 Tax=Pleurodeles waltl TaxID=8319 RepID=A0AAV7NCZ0_PLEWA|nr:hypothetical protein NDU88_002077 [Pleurodeles waltl]
MDRRSKRHAWWQTVPYGGSKPDKETMVFEKRAVLEALSGGRKMADKDMGALPVFLEEVEAFSVVSGFRVNLSKALALDLAFVRETMNDLLWRYPFRWEEDSVSHLGLRIARTVSETASVYYRLLLQGVRADLAGWRRYPIS